MTKNRAGFATACRNSLLVVIKEIAKAKTNKQIAERINRCVITEIGESVRIF